MNKRSLLTIAGLVSGLWLFGSPGKLCGQGNTWAGESLAQMVEAARWKLGFLRVNAALELNNVGYDSDIYYGYLDDPVDDFTLSAAVPVQVLCPVTKRLVLDVYDSPQYLFYLDTDRERAWNNTFRSQVHLALARFYIQAGGGSSSVRQRLSPELNINVRQKEDSLNATLLWQTSQEVSLALLGGAVRYDYGDAEFGGTSIAEALNRKESSLALVAYIQPNPRIRFSLDGRTETYVFTEEGTDARDARSYGIFGGFELIPREGEIVQAARLQGSLSLGYMRLDMKDPQSVDGSGLAGEVNLSAAFLRRTTARINYSRGFQFSVFSGAQYLVATAYGAGITRLFSRHAFLSYDLSIGKGSYPEGGTGGGTPHEFTYTMHSVTLNTTLARNLTMRFFGMVGRRASSEAGLAGNRSFFGFSLVYGAPPQSVSAPASRMPH